MEILCALLFVPFLFLSAKGVLAPFHLEKWLVAPFDFGDWPHLSGTAKREASNEIASAMGFFKRRIHGTGRVSN
jgi:hypothetical protein